MTRANNRKIRLIDLSLGFTEQHSHDKQSQVALF